VWGILYALKGGLVITQSKKKIKMQDTANFKKKIGKTAYDVSVHFSKTSKESLEDKLLRMIDNDEG
jgi:hypothetical protein